MEAELLRKRLRLVGRRLFAIRTIGGQGWAAVSAVVWVLLAVWVDQLWELPAAVRVASLVIALIVALLILVVAMWKAWRWTTREAVARQLDDVGGTQGRIRTGADLLAADRSVTLTAGLAALAVADANVLAHRTPAAQVTSLRRVLWPIAVLALLGAAIGLAYAAFPRFVAAEWRRFTRPFGEQAPFSRVVFHVEPGDTQLVFGQTLDVRVTTEGPSVDRLDLVIESEGAGEDSLPMFAEPGGAWRATLANVTTPIRYHVRSHAGRSERYQVKVITVPRLIGVRFRITPPDYTNRAAYEGPVPKGGLAGLPGTRVEVWASSNRPLSRGILRFAPPGTAPVELQPAARSATEVTGSFEIRTPGQVQLKVVDEDGQESSESFLAPISVLSDERPIVRLLEPREVSVATPTATIPVSIAAEDDYGIVRLQLFRSLNDSRALPLEVQIKRPPPTRAMEIVYLPLASYGLEPGDEIKLFARAEDNDPAGTKGAESTVSLIRIVSQEEFERMVQAREGLELLMTKYQQARRRVEGLESEADELRKKRKDRPKDAEATSADREDLRKLAAHARAEAAAIRAAANKKLGYDLDRHLTPQLERLSRQLDTAAKELEDLAGADKLNEEQIAGALEKMAGQLDREKQSVDKDALAALERLGVVMPLLEDAARFVALTLWQRDLATRLCAIKDLENPGDPAIRARMRDLQAEQESIRAALTKLLDDIEDHVTRLPEDPEMDGLRASARKFVDDVRGSKASEVMSAAEAGLAESSGKRGHANADKAAELLEEFVERSQGMNGIMGQGLGALRFQPGLQAGLGNTVEQLLAEAGLLPADGMGGTGGGSGGTGGTSARRGAAAKIGLYGSVPGFGQASGFGPIGSGSDAANRGGTATRSSGTQPDESTSAAGNRPAATSRSDAAIPAAYRRRVAEYFQRIADETGGK